MRASANFFVDDQSNKIEVPLIKIHDRLRWRAPIHVAAKFIDLDQLALSPQCGFASTAPGNRLTFAQQTAKLGLAVEVAREVWG